MINTPICRTGKFSLGAAAVALLILSGASAKADTVTLYQLSAYSYSDGGEFTAVTNPTLDLSAYSSLTKNVPGYSNSFETFCVENAVGFYPGTAYNYTLGQAIQNPKSSLSVGVAWLYSEFATGVLTDYDYSTTQANSHFSDRSGAANALQQAIWYLQGEISQPSNNVFINLLTTSTSLGGAGFSSLSSAEASAGSTNTYGVNVMELSNSDGIAQDQLYLNPSLNGNTQGVPDGGATVALLGLAMGGIAFLKRKLA